MRIRELILHNVRSFRGEHRISFVDPLTDQARPLTVIAGTNGTGKTTIFDAIEEMLNFLVSGGHLGELLLNEVLEKGLVILNLELSNPNIEYPNQVSSPPLFVVVGRYDLLPPDFETIWPYRVCYLFDRRNSEATKRGHVNSNSGEEVQGKLRDHINRMQGGTTELQGGLIYLPQDRYLPAISSGGILPPPPNRDWISHVHSPRNWQNSLENLWVWQNYLDLEQRAEANGHSHLKPFVETVENALGEGRKITVKEGRVLIPVAWSSNGDEVPKVRLDQLPSGEKQCLILLGELARRRRPGAVILIDEPETSLHPTLQRLLMHQLRQFARDWDAQLIVATHSMEILRAAHESQRLFLDQIEPTEAAEIDAEKAG